MKKEKTSVLFLCMHNSARSQMAEALLRQMDGDNFEVESAGLDPGSLHPLAIRVMAEIGIDISQQRSKQVFEFIRSSRRFNWVITVCDEAAERCPIYPGFANKLHWSFPDPAGFAGTEEEILERTRQVRDAIREKIDSWRRGLKQ